ncbi:Mycocerosic acid synthase [Aliiroseovarius pelagivivens]|uniref:Mycocerosic acid synthase n=1 Tax=Aliiroseovarius pelagivivens TaxID=1639690 RepID=A0A2R8AKI0_9RHOB|nr:alcohol dehydrogenase family protein [Aliiroseovarius pelagivivens]SPF76555.1 Mycocerosic acid synthase [Aliiroseovarius pelagivivens]
MANETMTGVILTGHGDYDQLSYRDDLSVPTPGPGEVQIRVAAAAVNNTDLNTRLAWYSKGDSDAEDASWSGNALKLPLIQGADVCGHISAVGEGVDPARIGERVLIEPSLREPNAAPDTAKYFGSECDGGFAQFTKVAARHAHKIDSTLSDVELASFPCSYSTSENMLTRTGVGEGDRVLVTGASGGVGSATVQLARARGAEVIALTSPAKIALLEELGASKALDRNADLVAELGKNSVDVVIDLVAGPGWPALLDVMRPGGRYAVAGAIGGPEVTLDVRTLYLKDLSFFGCTVLNSEVFPNLVKRIESGDIRPLVAETYPLAQIVDAQKSFASKGHMGKIVLNIP